MSSREDAVVSGQHGDAPVAAPSRPVPALDAPSPPAAAAPLPSPEPPAAAPVATDSFWGNARDLGLTAVALLTFAGLVYEYTYLHDLGIDFAAVDISPSLSLIAMSRVAVANAGAIVLVIILVAALRLLLEYWPGDRAWTARALNASRSRSVQAVFTLTAALLTCVLANRTALQAVADLRNRAVFAVHVTLAKDAHDYPPQFAQANARGDLFLVFNTASHVFVLDQMPPGAIPNVLPIGTVYELRKDDILSIETQVPSKRARNQ